MGTKATAAKPRGVPRRHWMGQDGREGATGSCPRSDLYHHFHVGVLLSEHPTLASAMRTLPWPYAEGSCAITCHGSCAITLQAHRCPIPRHTRQE